MGILTNYAPLDDISERVAVPALVFGILTPLFVLARCACDRLQTGKIWADDYLLIASVTVSSCGAALMTVACSWGLGKHEYDLHAYPAKKLPFQNAEVLIRRTLQLYFIAQVHYQVVIGLIGISMLVWYTRIFSTDNKKKFRLLCWWLVGSIAVFTVASTVAAIFQCDPIQVAWESQPAKCIDIEAHWKARGYFNLIMSFIVTFLPMPSIWGIPPYIDGLQMGRTRMMALCALFGVGIFVCITAILRVHAIGLAALMRDRTWNSMDLIMWSIIEDNVGITCACLPAMARQTQSILSKVWWCHTKRSWGSGSVAELLPRRVPNEKTREHSTTDSSGLSALEV